MFGEKPELITKQCCVCKKMIPLRVDRDDLDSSRQARNLRPAQCGVWRPDLR
jgi:hypothetical protein